MSDTESVDYLQTGFDPKSLTVPRLRSILVTYNISYPATAKKQQLIDLFNEHVVPQSKKILNQRARAKRSSRGIVDVESQSSASFDDHELMPPPTATRARSPRKSTRVKQESEEPEHAPELRSPRKRQVRSTSRQLAPTSDEDELPKAESARPGRRSRTKTPQVKEEEFDDDHVLRESGEDESVFTSDNPFQSGSSPPPVKTPSNRRRTTGAESTKATASSTTRRRTDGPVTSSDKSSKYSKTYEIPLARKSPKTPEPDVVEAGEEFTPDEQLELAQQEAERGPLVRQPKPARRGSSLATPLWVLVLTLLGAYAAWYRQEKIAVGYCGVGRPAQSIIPPNIRLPAWAADSKVAEWLSEVELPPAVLATLEPQCEPCPVHATCYDDFSVKCDDDYILKAHPLSLGGLIPLPPTCEPDGEKVRRVKAVADKAVEELRDRRAKFECGELVDEEGEETNTPAINEQDLKEVISEKRSKKLDKQEFDDLWASALGDIKERDEVEVEVQQTPDSGGIPNTRLSSTSLARLPITCAIRRSLWLGFARFRLYLLLVILSTGSLFYARSRYRSHRATVAQIPALVDIVMDKLSAQKEIAYDDSTEDPFLFLPNLRDDVLRAMHSLAERERVWQRVRPVVEQNSNVRTGQREGRNGEVGRAWEWIGPTASLTAGGGEASARRRRSARVSFGPGVKKEEEDDEDVKTPVAEMVEKSQDRSGIHRRWEEPRPIY